MKILITGGAGCLGSNLIEKWLPQGYEICVLDNFATGKREVVPDFSGLEVHEGHIADIEFVDKCFDSFRPDVVVHSAASYKDPNNWKEDARTNVEGAISVARACLKFDVEKVINFQTSLCFGRPENLPITADHPERPFTSYGISKTAGEMYLLQSGLNVISLRLANITGPRLAIGPIPTFYERLRAGKSCFCSDTKRDFLDMEDFLTLMDLLIEKNLPSGKFNISTGKSHSILEIFNLVATYLQVEIQKEPDVIPAGHDDVAEVVLDPSKTFDLLGWEAKIGFEETINRMLSWYDQHGVSAIYSHLKSPTEKNDKGE